MANDSTIWTQSFRHAHWRSSAGNKGNASGTRRYMGELEGHGVRRGRRPPSRLLYLRHDTDAFLVVDMSICLLYVHR